MTGESYITDRMTGIAYERTSPEGRELLLRSLEHARAYAYEATMSDYSMATIDHATAQVKAAERALLDAGHEIPAW